MSETKYFGKYRGTVVQNADPERRARIQAIVPDVTGTAASPWALPCVPVAGMQMGVFVLPRLGAGVWIEYEQGDPDYPIWTGGFWGPAAELPALALAGNPGSPSMVCQTGLGNSISISDVEGPTGGIMLKSRAGAVIIVNDAGITISNGKGATIVMAGPTVTINDGALVVA